MPPRKYKTNHRGRGGGGGGYSSAEAVKARNSDQGEEEYWANKAAGVSNGYDPMSSNPGKGRGKGGGRGAGAAEPDDEESGSGSGSGSEAEQAPKAKPEAKAPKEEEPKREKKPKEAKEDKDELPVFKRSNPNDVKTNIDKDGIGHNGELSRKQREELDKAAAKKRYEELHKQGKTDEAKADLKRLEEVKQRRAEAAKKKLEDEAAAKAAEAASRSNPKAGMQAELKDMMGGVAAGQRKKKGGGGDKDDDKNDKDKLINGADQSEVYAPYASKEKAAQAPQMRKPTDGTIQACRAVEEDFM